MRYRLVCAGQIMGDGFLRMTTPDEARPRGIGRRRLIAAAVATGGSALYGRSVLGAAGLLDRAAEVSARATRGSQQQVTDTLPPPVQRWHPGDFITRVDTNGERLLALTFDDGPSPYNTYSVLRTLADRRIKATFFVIGVNVRSFPQIARDIVSEGHELGNHSVYHTPYRSTELSAQIGPNQAIIRAETGVLPVANRAPGLTKGAAILDRCAEHGLYEAHTDMTTYDWLSPRHSASTLFNEFVAYHHPGAFGLYHDGGGNRPTPVALPMIIDYALSIGYTFTTATELTARGSPLPGQRSYSSRSTAALLRAEESATADGGIPIQAFDRCAYDAYGELVHRLEDPSVTRVERSRIVEVLAEIDALLSDR